MATFLQEYKLVVNIKRSMMLLLLKKKKKTLDIFKVNEKIMSCKKANLSNY